jgi:hypothetical protein
MGWSPPTGRRSSARRSGCRQPWPYVGQDRRGLRRSRYNRRFPTPGAGSSLDRNVDSFTDPTDRWPGRHRLVRRSRRSSAMPATRSPSRSRAASSVPTIRVRRGVVEDLTGACLFPGAPATDADRGLTGGTGVTVASERIARRAAGRTSDRSRARRWSSTGSSIKGAPLGLQRTEAGPPRTGVGVRVATRIDHDADPARRREGAQG